MRMQVALQLYSVKENVDKDFIGTLEQVARIGYEGVEFAGYGGLPAKRLKENLDRLGLRAAGSHVSMERLRESLQEEIEYNLEIGNKNIVCPWHVAQTTAEYLDLCDFLNKTGETLQRHGMKLFYHNHGHEFEQVDGVRGLDLIWQNTDPSLVRSELDLFWASHAGIVPVDYLEKLGGRATLLHCKDMDSGNRDRTIEFGEGSIDYDSILSSLKNEKAGDVEWLIIEQEHFENPRMECVETGYRNMKKMLNEV